MQHDVHRVAFSSSPLPRSLSFYLSRLAHWVSSVTRISRAAPVAARHACRRPRAVRRCGPLSTRTHQDFCHHVMCLFDTWFFSCIEFVPSPSSSTLPSRVVPSPSSSCSTSASIFLAPPGRQSFSLALLAPRQLLFLSLAILALPEP